MEEEKKEGDDPVLKQYGKFFLAIWIEKQGANGFCELYWRIVKNDDFEFDKINKTDKKFSKAFDYSNYGTLFNICGWPVRLLYNKTLRH